MLHIFERTDEVLQAAAEYFVQKATEAINQQQRFTVALSGGSSPKGLFELLSSQYKNHLDWTKLYFFFGDERYVPADHPDSNALMAKKALFDPLHILKHQIFTIDTAKDPNIDALGYQEAIEQHFAPGPPRFDLILLGLGDNSHTASLFPHTDVLDVREAGVRAVWVEEKQTYRITFTAPLINMAAHIAFLLFGEGKAEAVHHILKGEKDYKEYPAQLIKPSNGDVEWFMDQAAARLVV